MIKIGDVPEITQDFMDQHNSALKEKIAELEKDIILLKFEKDRSDSLIEVKNIVIKEYQGIIDDYQKLIKAHERK